MHLMMTSPGLLNDTSKIFSDSILFHQGIFKFDLCFDLFPLLRLKPMSMHVKNYTLICTLYISNTLFQQEMMKPKLTWLKSHRDWKLEQPRLDWMQPLAVPQDWEQHHKLFFGVFNYLLHLYIFAFDKIVV